MKKYMIISILVVLIVATCVIVILATQKTNKPGSNTKADKPVIVSDDIKLDEISFNGIKIGDKVKDEMKNIVMDAPFKYSYERIHIDTDKEDNITYLGFHTLTDTYGNVTQDLNDIEIEYEGKSLKTLDDFKEIFGEGKEFEREDDYYRIKYTDGNTELILFVYNDKLYNLDLEVVKELMK